MAGFSSHSLMSVRNINEQDWKQMTTMKKKTMKKRNVRDYPNLVRWEAAEMHKKIIITWYEALSWGYHGESLWMYKYMDLRCFEKIGFEKLGSVFFM